MERIPNSKKFINLVEFLESSDWYLHEMIVLCTGIIKFFVLGFWVKASALIKKLCWHEAKDMLDQIGIESSRVAFLLLIFPLVLSRQGFI